MGPLTLHAPCFHMLCTLPLCPLDPAYMYFTFLSPFVMPLHPLHALCTLHPLYFAIAPFVLFAPCLHTLCIICILILHSKGAPCLFALCALLSCFAFSPFLCTLHAFMLFAPFTLSLCILLCPACVLVPWILHSVFVRFVTFTPSVSFMPCLCTLHALYLFASCLHTPVTAFVP